MHTRVIHVRNSRRSAREFFIGRRREGHHFGNPFSHQQRSIAAVKVETREQSIEYFEAWLRGTAHQEVEPDRRSWILTHMHMLRGRDLVCYCDPEPCHGHVYAKILTELYGDESL